MAFQRSRFSNDRGSRPNCYGMNPTKNNKVLLIIDFFGADMFLIKILSIFFFQLLDQSDALGQLGIELPY